MQIEELLEKFRESDLYHHTIYVQNFAPKKVRAIITEKISEFDENDFRDIMFNYFMLGRMGEQAVNDILENNDFNEIKFQLLNLFVGREPILKRFKSFLKLTGVGLFFGTHFLAAVTDNEFIIYHDYVLEGVKELLPRIAPEKVETAEEYMDFNELCKEIRDAYGFRDLGEVHEFFWHGHSKNWKE